MLTEVDITNQKNRILSKVNNYHDAEDILSEALLYYHKVGSKHHIINPRGLLSKISNYKIKDYYRRKYNTPCQDEYLDGVLISCEDKEGMGEYKDILTQDEYKVMVLRYIYGYSNEDISDTLGICIGDVKRFVNNIKKQLIDLY